MPSLDLRTLYARYGALIYARCRHILRDDAAAEDATQDVFVRLVQSGEPLEDGAMVRWLIRVTTNLCLNRLRDGRWEELTGEPIDRPGPSLEREICASDFVRALFEQAPARLVPAAKLRHEGLPHQAVADKLGVSRRTVINRLNAFDAFARRFAREVR